MLNDWRLLYVNLHVGDLAAARAFYENDLGFEPIAEGPGTVSYPAGHAVLCLDRAEDAGVPRRRAGTVRSPSRSSSTTSTRCARHWRRAAPSSRRRWCPRPGR
ncbi:VOC family protein [Actinomadura yumaensis]|uniref:VOC family protein n=1 Tax=Actinomadura yumaensis TaxID=111807 RepID=UPI003619B09E